MPTNDSFEFPPKITTFPVYFRLKVIPNQPKTEYVSTMDDGTIKIRVAAIPEKGRANKEIIRFFAELLGVTKDRVEITSGAGDSTKLLRIR